jgi:hypothetical protein
MWLASPLVDSVNDATASTPQRLRGAEKQQSGLETSFVQAGPLNIGPDLVGIRW